MSEKAPRHRARWVSPLMRRVLLVNFVPLALLLGAVLYADQYQDGLLEAEVAALREQARIYAGALGESAVRVSDPNNPVLVPDIARPLLRRLTDPTPNAGAKIYAPDGTLVADSRVRLGAGGAVTTEPLPTPQARGPVLGVVSRVYDDVLALLPHTRAATVTLAPNAPTITLESHFFPTGKNAGRIVLKLSGCDSISAAETLAGQQLLVPTSALPALDPDTFFVRDLLGCTLYDSDLAIGTIVDLEFATAPDGRTRLPDAAPLLAVQLLATPDAEPVLIPFIRAWLSSVDLPTRRIVMHLPEGLISHDVDQNLTSAS